MKISVLNSLMIATAFLASQMTFGRIALANESAIELANEGPLSEASDAPLIHPWNDEAEERLYMSGNRLQTMQGKSDVWSVLPYITTVKSQEKRNLCTIFAMQAVLETAFLQAYPTQNNADFSEEWLQYLNSLVSETGGGNGSTVIRNFGLAKKYGVPGENRMPYDGSIWNKNSAQASKYCSGLAGMEMTRCLAGHRSPRLMRLSDAELKNPQSPNHDPDFVNARASAAQVRNAFTKGLSGGIVGSVSEIKSLLRRGVTLTMEVNIYYESWNHAHGSTLGMIPDSKEWIKGNVSYPEPGSVDRAASRSAPARHAVQIVGYDDNVEITYKKKMSDGSTRIFTRKGVYIFKNSWGTNKFGSKFVYEKKRIPGFGMILQDHANEFGQFFAVSARGAKSTKL